MSLRVLTVSLLACALCAALVPAARAAGTSPVITKVRPLDVAIGETLTIAGRGFLPGKLKNTVVFQRDDAQPVFMEASTATASRITLVVPVKLLPFLADKGGTPSATRFRLRVLARRLGRSFTKAAASPRIAPPKDAGTGSGDAGRGGAGGGTPAAPANAASPPAAAAPDAQPPPAPVDPRSDHDGDGLSLGEEYLAWARYGGHKLPLTYSDGTQESGGPAPVTPGVYPDVSHLRESASEPPNGLLTADEKDVEGDGLSNWDELHGAFTTFANMDDQPMLDWLDPDSDGDGVKDGADDQDHDGTYGGVELTTSRRSRRATTAA